jgi:membrane glycosyltransferase
LLALVAVQTTVATWSLTYTFPYPWLNGFEAAIAAVFAVLFSWVSFSFWSSLAGFCTLWKGRSRFSIDASTLGVVDEDPLHSRTAVLMPICNEDVDRVFAGVEATYRSLAETGHLVHFDFFILSDTSDREGEVEEELAWAELCRNVQGFGRIFYRHRRNNIKRKSGNIADFLRRWGRSYDYMVVLDADSIMAGRTLVRLARIMERCPNAGIVQTAPTTVNRESLYARLQQFASRVYGPMLTAGLRFWQLGESYYWGHNAILRIEPFTRYCGLGRLPGEPPLGGEILSHDFVEAALMGRAGWEVWIVDDSSGSYEETPPSLLDELKRDRRWCQGNLQHLKLIFTDGLRGGHLAIFLMGVMAYASALFWFVFLLLSSIEAVAQALLPPVYFFSQPSLFPIWPQWRPGWAIALLSATALLLFLPKFFAFLLIVRKRETGLFGGFIPLSLSIFLETVISSLLAPIRMWFHSKFVALTLLRRQIKWSSQQRSDNQLGWREGLRAYGVASVLAFLWIATLWRFNPSFLWWLLPVAVPLLLSVPLSVYSSRISVGLRLRKWHLLLIPEEIHASGIVKTFQNSLKQRRCRENALAGFERAVLDGFANAVHTVFLRRKAVKSPRAKARTAELLRKALADGPANLSQPDKAHLLGDAEAMARLHDQAWQRRAGGGDGFAGVKKWYAEEA